MQCIQGNQESLSQSDRENYSILSTQINILHVHGHEPCQKREIFKTTCLLSYRKNIFNAHFTFTNLLNE